MKFHERFDIAVNLTEAQQRFINRAYNEVFLSFFYDLNDNTRFGIHRAIASTLGDRYAFNQSLDELIGADFLRNLHAIEAFFAALPYKHREADLLIQDLLAQSEVDLGIEWRDGRFLRKGVGLLDAALVNDPLRWLRGAGYQSVLIPFEKGLSHFLAAKGKVELLADVITDMYESVEALAKIVTGRDNRDLSAHRELFLSKVSATEAYKAMLADYIAYANNFRHATAESKPQPRLSEREVESFLYLTGIFLRLAMPDNT
ncbi:MAG: hypothetical protein AB7N91_10860 [Candidatus Tectimicrobiota bacterium]